MFIKLMPQTLDEIKKLHSEQWVLLGNPKRDPNGNLVSGIVLFAGQDQNELYARARREAFGEVVYWQTSHEPPRKAIAS